MAVPPFSVATNPNASGFGLVQQTESARMLVLLSSLVSGVNPDGTVVSGPFFDVKSYGAVGDGVTDDTTAVQAAYTAAVPSGGTVLFEPGQYLMSSPISQQYGTASAPTAAVSLVALSAAGHIGDVLYPTEKGNVALVASGTFPVGRYLIEYLSNPAGPQGGTGAWIKGLNLECQSRAAGLLLQGTRGFNVQNVSINHTAAASGGVLNRFGSLTVAAIGTEGAWNNFHDLIIDYAANACIDHNAPNEDCFYSTRCQNGGTATIFLDSASVCSFYGGTSSGGQRGWDIAGGWIGTVVGFTTETNGNAWNAVRSFGASNAVNGPNTQTFIACEFGNNPPGGNGEADASIVRLAFIAGRPQQIVFDNCEFFGNAGATTKDWVYVDASCTGTAVFKDCNFHGGFTTNKFNDASGNNVLRFYRCVGINPIGVVVIAVPATTVATAPLPVDATFYVTANAAGSVTCTIQNGPAVVVPASAVVPIRVPAGRTLTPVYANNPTWVVEEE